MRMKTMINTKTCIIVIQFKAHLFSTYKYGLKMRMKTMINTKTCIIVIQFKARLCSTYNTKCC